MTVFEAARAVSCGEAARRLNLPVRGHGGRLWTRCLFHDDRNPSLCLYEGDRGFYCFACHESGDAVKLYARALGLRPADAARRLCEDFGLEWEPWRQSGAQRPCAPQPRAQAKALEESLSRLRAERELQLAGQIAREESVMDARQLALRALYPAGDQSWTGAVWQDAEWQDALGRRSRLKERLGMLGSMSYQELWEEMKCQ